jgi:EthD domain-containing protein
VIKTIAFLKCKPGLTREQFIDYYERRHAPLILSIAPQICGYRRNFLIEEGAILFPGARRPDFDVVTELWYPSESAFAQAMAAFTDPANAARIAADEEHLFERSRTRFFRVDEYSSAQLPAGAAGAPELPDLV